LTRRRHAKNSLTLHAKPGSASPPSIVSSPPITATPLAVITAT